MQEIQAALQGELGTMRFVAGAIWAIEAVRGQIRVSRWPSAAVSSTLCPMSDQVLRVGAKDNAFGALVNAREWR